MKGKYDYTFIKILDGISSTCTYCITFTSNKLGETEQVASPTDCKSAVYDCDGSTPSLPTKKSEEKT